MVALKLLLTAGKYYYLKRDRKENIALNLLDLIIMNILFTGLFVQANLMYFNAGNYCWYTNDRLVRTFYLVFCTFSILGYLQFVWCIVLSMMVPLGFFIIHKLVDHRLVQGVANNDIFADGLMGGIMQAPLPIPEILSQINRTKFNTGKFGL